MKLTKYSIRKHNNYDAFIICKMAKYIPITYQLFIQYFKEYY